MNILCIIYNIPVYGKCDYYHTDTCSPTIFTYRLSGELMMCSSVMYETTPSFNINDTYMAFQNI